MNLRLTLFITLSLMSLSALWWLWPRPPQPQAASDTPLAVAGNLVHWRVENGRRVQGPARFAVRVGETITLEVASDRRDSLHVHGDDLTLPLLPDKSIRLDWTPAHSGRFDLELHEAGFTLSQVDVLPR